MSLPTPEPNNFDVAAKILGAHCPCGTHLLGVAIVQSGAEPAWSADFAVTTFLPPTLPNIPRARREFQHSAPPGSSVGVVSVCTIKPGGLVIPIWQVHYLVRSSTSSIDAESRNPSPSSDRLRSNDDISDANIQEKKLPCQQKTNTCTQRNQEKKVPCQQKTNTCTQHSVTLGLSYTGTRQSKSPTAKPKRVRSTRMQSAKQPPADYQHNKSHPCDATTPKIATIQRVKFVPATQHSQPTGSVSNTKSYSDRKYISIAKVADKYPTQDHLDAALIYITKENIRSIPARIISFFSAAKKRVYYTLRRLLWKASKLNSHKESEILEQEGIRLKEIHKKMAIKSGFQVVTSQQHPAEIAAAIHHLVHHRSQPHRDDTGNSTMSPICTWAHTVIGPLRLQQSHQYLSSLLSNIDEAFGFTPEIHQAMLKAKLQMVRFQSPIECISYRLA